MFLVFSAIKCEKTLKEKQNIKKKPSICTNFKNTPRRKFLDRERGRIPGSEFIYKLYLKTSVVSFNNSSNDETILVENWTKERNYLWKSRFNLWPGIRFNAVSRMVYGNRQTTLMYAFTVVVFIDHCCHLV